MVYSPAQFQLELVSQHIDQTRLVNELLHDGFLDYSEIQWWQEDEDENRPEIYQWKAFNRFESRDYDRLIASEIPVLDSNFGTWVGITSWWTPYEHYVYPELIRAIFGEVLSDNGHQKTA